MTQSQPAHQRHRLQGILYEGMRTLHEELPDGVVDETTMAALSDCVDRVSTFPGLGITDARGRMLALTRALHALTEGLVPLSEHKLLDFRSFPEILAKIEAGLETASDELLPEHAGPVRPGQGS
jgi:hypothetical protein